MKKSTLLAVLAPLLVAVLILLLWMLIVRLHLFHESALPNPLQVSKAFAAELRSGRLATDLITSLFRVSMGFGAAVLAGVPMGLWMGQQIVARLAFLPLINFLRNLSPLAWIPVCHSLVRSGRCLVCFSNFSFSLLPNSAGHDGSSRERSFGLPESCPELRDVELGAFVPRHAARDYAQVITALRVTAGICWLVVVAAEMIAGRDGLGFAVMDSRNGLRTDILVVEMIVIGLVGVAIDRMLVQLVKIPSVRWGYER